MIRICVVVSILLYASSADAIPRAGTCPNGTEWNVASGACVKKRAAPRMSGQDKFNRANEDLEGRGKNPDPKRGITLLEQACTADHHAASCQLLGFLYARGRAPAAKNDDKAAEFFAKGCSLKDLDSCVDVGLLALRRGDDAKARIAFQHACDLGSGRACTHAGDLFEMGRGGAKDAAKAAAMFRRGMETLAKHCPTGITTPGIADGGACFYVGYMHERGKVTAKDLPKAFAAYKAGCTAGHGQACLGLGRAHELGYAGAIDMEAANKAYDRGCTDFDNGPACQTIAANLGETKRDLPRAFKLATRACELDPEYCGTLGEFYRLGFGIDAPDQIKATASYKAACNNGGIVWCINFAERAYGGVGMAKDVDAAVDAAERGCLGHDFSACGVGARYLLEMKQDARAQKIAKAGCDEKDGRSCHWLGWIHENGRGVDQSGTKALALYQQACTRDEPIGCDSVARFHHEGLGGVAKDPAKAFALYQQACKGGNKRLHSAACASHAKMAATGDGVARDPKLALAGYLRACEYHVAGACYQVWDLKVETNASREDVLKLLDATCKEDHLEACFAKADALMSSESETDRRAAYEIVENGCKRKVEAGCLRQAEMLTWGIGVTKNPGRAEELFKASCDGGTSWACQGLGTVYMKTKKFEEAHTQFKRGCEAGLADSCMMIGWQFRNAIGATWDLAAAAKFYAKACEMGSRVGCNNLGNLHRHGQGVAVNHKKARTLYESACRPGEAVGCAGYGVSLWKGLGGTVDKKRAEEMYRRSCTTKGDLDAEGCSDLADLLEETKGSSSEIARLRTLAFARAAEQAAENPYFLYVLGKYHRAGVATIKDPVKSLDHFSQSCEKFQALGCVEAGKALRASGKQADADRARVYLERACAASMEEACGLSKGKAGGPTPVAKGKGCCSGQVAPDAQTGALLLLVVSVMLWPRRRRATR